MDQPKDNKMDVFIHCQHNVLHNCYMTWSSVLLLHIFNFHQDQKKGSKEGLQIWQLGLWEMSWLKDHVAINNWKSLMRRKGTQKKLSQGKKVRGRGTWQSDMTEGTQAKKSWNAGVNFRKGYLPVACFGSNERKTAKKSLKCTTWRKPTTYLCNFFLTNTAKMLWMH